MKGVQEVDVGSRGKVDGDGVKFVYSRDVSINVTDRFIKRLRLV